MGVYSSLAEMRKELSGMGMMPNSRIADTVFLRRVSEEYHRLHEKGARNEYGIPKACYAMLEQGDITEFPESLKPALAQTRKLWKSTSRKAWQGNGPGKTDEDIITLALYHARNGSICYVMTYDDDIRAPLAQAMKEYTNLRLCRQSLHPAGAIVMEMEERGEALLFPPEILGAIYGMATPRAPEYYLLAAKVPLAGKLEEAALSIHPIQDCIRKEESGVSRYRIFPVDLDEIRGKANAERIKKDYAKQSTERLSGPMILKITKTRKYGVMEMRVDRIDNKIRGGRVVTSYTTDIPRPWIHVENRYLKEFSPETLEAIKEAKSRHPK